MKKSRFTESQIVAVLKEEKGEVPVAQLTRKHGIGAASGARSSSPRKLQFTTVY